MRTFVLALLIASVFTLGDNPGGCVWADFQPVLDAANACEAEFQKEQFVNKDNIKLLFTSWRAFSNKCLGTSYNQPKWDCYIKAEALEKSILKLVDDVNTGKSQAAVTIDVGVIIAQTPGFNQSCFPQSQALIF